MKVNIRGDIGYEVSGTDVANQIDYLSGEQEAIDIHINSMGGNVDDALSIISANLNSKAIINTYNMGIAASSAFQIWLSGNVLHAMDYGRWMAHDPRLSNGKTIEEMDAKDPNKEALINIRDQIATIISNRTGKSYAAVLTIMKAETWFDVKKMKEVFGLSINVISSKAKPNVKKNATISEFVNIISNFNPEFDSTTNDKPMTEFKSILNKLDLNENVSSPEAKIENAIDLLNSQVKADKLKIEGFESKVSTLEKENKAFMEAAKTSIETEADSFADKLITNGVIKADGKDTLVALYVANPENTKKTFSDNLILKITDKIDNNGKPEHTGSEKIVSFKDDNGNTIRKDWNYYTTHATNELDKIMAEETPEFLAIWKEEFGTDYKEEKIQTPQ